MKASTYQELSKRTLIEYPGFQLTDKEIMTIWVSVGIAGEAGELMEVIKHGIFHRHGLDISHVREELGDLMWYIAGICSTLDISLSEVMQENIDKLSKRYPNGYNETDSKRRIDK